MFGLAAALGARDRVQRRAGDARGFGGARLPRLADTPDITVELIAQRRGARRRRRAGRARGRAGDRQRAASRRRRRLPLRARCPPRRGRDPARRPSRRSRRRKVGVLLINLGTPDGARRAVGAALSRRVPVGPARRRDPAIAWQPILRGFVLDHPAEEVGARLRPGVARGRLAARRDHAGADARRCRARSAPGVMVDWAMRYGNPAIADRLAAMKDAGCERILLAPLYPQYCAATTATANDKAFARAGGDALAAGDPDAAALS